MESLCFVSGDIETAELSPAITDSYITMKESSGSLKAPETYKTPEAIAGAIEKEKKKIREKAALFPWIARIVCIGYNLKGKTQTMIDEDEALILRTFFMVIESNFPVRMVGKFWDGFDAPFIRARAMVHNLRIPAPLRYYRPVTSIEEIFGGNGKLDDYAFMLGIGGKIGKGDQVAAMWAKRDFSAISTYCARDVDIVAEVMRRYEGGEL